MNILVLNSGSSSLKFDVMRVDLDGGSPAAVSRVANGAINRIGDDDEFADVRCTLVSSPESAVDRHDVPDIRGHRDAVSFTFAQTWNPAIGLVLCVGLSKTYGAPVAPQTILDGLATP